MGPFVDADTGALNDGDPLVNWELGLLITEECTPVGNNVTDFWLPVEIAASADTDTPVVPETNDDKCDNAAEAVEPGTNDLPRPGL